MKNFFDPSDTLVEEVVEQIEASTPLQSKVFIPSLSNPGTAMPLSTEPDTGTVPSVVSGVINTDVGRHRIYPQEHKEPKVRIKIPITVNDILRTINTTFPLTIRRAGVGSGFGKWPKGHAHIHAKAYIHKNESYVEWNNALGDMEAGFAIVAGIAAHELGLVKKLKMVNINGHSTAAPVAASIIGRAAELLIPYQSVVDELFEPEGGYADCSVEELVELYQVPKEVIIKRLGGIYHQYLRSPDNKLQSLQDKIFNGCDLNKDQDVIAKRFREHQQLVDGELVEDIYDTGVDS